MSKQKKKQVLSSILINGLVFFGLVALTFWLIFKDQDMGQVLKVVGEAKLPFLLLGVLLMVGYFAMEAWNISKLLTTLGEKVSFKTAFRYVMVEFFFCSVTPGASGGQPIEIYYMSKDGVSAANGTLAVLIQTTGVQFAVVGLGIISAMFWNGYLSGPVALLFAIGFMINVVALLVLFLSIFYTNGLRKFLKSFFGFLHSKGLKKAGELQESVDKGLDKYAEGAKYIGKNKKQFRLAILRATVQMSLFYLVPFCVYLAFGLSGTSIFSFFAMQSILFVSTSGLPIPGAIGASESVFLALYNVAFGEAMLGSAMLLSRGISFYLFVAVSMIFVFATMIRQKRKN